MARLYMLPLSIYTCWGNWRIVVSVYSKGLCLIEISHSYPPNTGQLWITQPFQLWIASLSKRYVIRVMESISACQLIV
ncbi:MAG: hypothetical protein RIM23_12800 [Coleofasciculus sp. G3-WIS-01]|uniref:hypothetical protein n=1 Tax=Coleofasciculus sp. G3-WIS-01 TaxID=3069528 RepID=UPI0032FDCAA3